MHNVVRRAVRWTEERTGLELRRSEPGPGDRRRAAILATAGVTTVIDGGANRGAYGIALRRGGYRGRIVSLEPVFAQFAELDRTAGNDPWWECRQVALGARQEMLPINVSNHNGVASSLLGAPEGSQGGDFAFIGTETVEVVTLDSLEIADASIALKLDLEGYEPQALAGATETLPRVQVLEIELSLVPSWKTANRGDYRATIARLESEGFTLVGLSPGTTDWSTGHVLEIDALLQRV